MAKLSILVPTYFQETYLEACVLSALSARLAPGDQIEVLILDDGSTDGTPEVGADLVSRFPDQVRYRWQENTGHVARNVNVLAAEATGDLLLLFAGDDLFPDGWDAATRMKRFARDSDLAVTFTEGESFASENPDQRRQVQDPRLVALLEDTSSEVILREHLKRHPFHFFLQATILRRDFFDAIGGYDETLAADDTAFPLRVFQGLVRKGLHHGVDRGTFFLYRQHGESLQHQNLRSLLLKLEFYGREIAPEYHRNFAKRLLRNLERLPWTILWSRQTRDALNAALQPPLARELLLRASIRKLRLRQGDT